MARKPAGLPSFELTAPVLAKALPKGPEWIHEIKHDGHRCAAVIKDGTVRLFTRTHRDVTRRFHVIATALLPLRDHEAIIDGEIGAQNALGIATLDNLHRALEAGVYESLVYVAFDLLFLDGQDLRRWPLLSRKQALRDLLKPLEGTRIQYSNHLEGDPTRLYERLCELGAEGIVSKAAHAPYRGGRDPSWLKIKCRGRAEKHAKTVEKWNIKKRPLPRR
jgi:bifunctional non-homologous end joining protein LigD